MTGTYLTSITPDSLSGLVFAFEGIKNTIVLMNGPTGCKFYHSATSDNQMLRQLEFDPLSYPELWYFGQPRVPCTYLDKRDYVYGSREKLQEAIAYLKNNLSFDLLVIVNSPGAALIGDDLVKIAEAGNDEFPIMTIETPGYSRHVWEGYSEATCQLIRRFSVGDKKHMHAEHKKRVNILGMSIYQKYYEGDILELTRLLGLGDVEVGCVLCAGCSVAEISNLSDADLNIVVNPIYGMESARLLQELHGTPYIVCDGQPIGFTATENLMKQIFTFLDCNQEKFVEESEKTRARSYIYLSRLSSLTGLPKGVKFALQGTSSECLGFSRFLIQYFGMSADSICVLDEGPDFEALKNLLKSHSMAEALQKDILHTDAQLVFSDGNIIAKLKALHHEFSGIEISLPTIGYTDVIPKTCMGLYGSLLICEQIINGIVY